MRDAASQFVDGKDDEGNMKNGGKKKGISLSDV